MNKKQPAAPQAVFYASTTYAAPTAKQATHFQVYTLTRDDDTYFIKSCKDE